MHCSDSAIGRDPAAIKAARLRNDLDVVDQALVKRCSVKRDMVAQRGKALGRLGVAPTDIAEN